MTKELLPGLGSGALREALLNPEFQYRVAEKWWNDSAGPDRPFHRQRESSIYQIYLDRVREVIGIALSLSSPIEPPQTEMARHSGRQEVLIAVAHVLNKKDLSTQRRVSGFVGGKEALEALLTELLRPTAQASSEIRELAQALANGWNTRKSDPQFKADMDLVAKKLLEALAPSRQGAAKRVEG